MKCAGAPLCKTTSVVMCATKHPPTTEVKVYGKITGTEDQYILLLRYTDQ
jgi:hypothetical protein